jgi:hypothetical protein
VSFAGVLADAGNKLAAVFMTRSGLGGPRGIGSFGAAAGASPVKAGDKF